MAASRFTSRGRRNSNLKLKIRKGKKCKILKQIFAYVNGIVNFAKINFWNDEAGDYILQKLFQRVLCGSK